MVEHVQTPMRRSFTLPASAIPDEIFRLENPEYIAKRLEQPVAAGQLWMAKTEVGAQYVLVGGVNDDARLITAIPMSNNDAERTEEALVVRNTPLGMTMVAWPQLATEVPVRILFKPLGEFGQAASDALVNDREDDALGIERATTPEDATTSAAKAIVEIRRCMEAWHAMCAKLPKLHDEQKVTRHSGEELEAYANALKTVLQLSPGQRIAVSRGKALTAEQQRKMAEAGFPQSPYDKPAVDDDYLIEVEQPLWRAAADAYAASGLPGDSREGLAYKAQFELAARVNGHGVQALRGALHKAANEVLSASGSR
ncbi:MULTISPECIES: hypothetical protein [unclassified Bifidobacterium]|uniref:hypothetical protein n=1 Tax=unclassified Bifidobacterium TaxID=2608897 RepID=UPI001126F75F|nr:MULTISPECIES: hypothetical protein [unclassified Bifidobacterium]TPF77651.1 hypothetical protein BW09_08625 [Bifidobacterium sp. UTCIF-1]TPF79949.1 hypothetical protein BW08_07420 [Bifidobacterium sp. UTCIF-24]TPF81795.1 hypothetical protein BW12_08090 [Bifidobacterium sp. UTCIF-3]TPF83684.1 hypothetical protein BW07_08675 [Bifidobacterium sp. UTCIF-36]TPF88669.1 hypothetical protein BW10_08535 [Bifidobacterium sp. UTBIF-56]